jgi:RNA polymerase sigma-70 factor (ECF subfamily)
MSSPSPKLGSAIDLVFDDAAATQAAPAATPHEEALHLFDTCAGSLFRYVRSLGLDAEGAHDVVQETFLALFHHLGRNRPRDNMKGWLFRVAHNQSLKHRQKMKRRQTGNVPNVELAELVVDPSLNPEQRMAEEQHQVRLREVWRALPERGRQCLTLRAEGLKYREIASVLGISLGAVAKSVTRSLARLANV